MEREVRIVVVDDWERARRGFKELLESHAGWKVVGEAGDGEEAIQLVKDLEPDILTTDLQHGGLGGLEIARWIAQNLPKVRVLMVTMSGSVQLLREMVEAGAHGYVAKSDVDRSLIKAVVTLLKGQLFFAGTFSSILHDGFGPIPRLMRPENILTARETEIVVLLVRGLNSQEIASECHVSLGTAETYRATIMDKLQLNSMQQLARYAVKTKLVDVSRS